MGVLGSLCVLVHIMTFHISTVAHGQECTRTHARTRTHAHTQIHPYTSSSNRGYLSVKKIHIIKNTFHFMQIAEHPLRT